MMRACAYSSTCVERCRGFSVVMPLQARVTLEIVHFDRRAVGGAPEGCARYFLFDVPLRALFGYGVISGRVWE